MKTFTYKGYDAAGAAQSGHIEALSAKSAREQLAAHQIFVAHLVASSSRPGSFAQSLRGVFYRELSALLRSGMPLVPGLSMLLNTPELQTAFSVLSGVRDQVREGRGFATALETMAPRTKPFEISAIDVAERTGTLDAVLDQLADVIESHQQLRERVQRAMIYPVLILILGVVVALVMLGVLLPRMETITGGFLAMPALTRFMLGCSRMLFPWGILAGGVLLGLGSWVVGRILQDVSRRIWLEAVFLRLPGQRAYRYLLAARFARTLSILTRAGVPLVEGVALAGRATGSGLCAERAVAASHAVRHGQNLEAAVRTIPPLADTLGGWVAVGEAGGDLAGMLDHAAMRCERQFDHHLARLLALLEPLLLLLVGGFVLLITLSVMLPIFSLTDAVLQ
ncbi:MAG: type II secretion system F family protein [Kiritimatiellia bacterium]